MWERYQWTEKCPKCWKEMEYYDAPTCLTYSWMCEECWYSSPLDYYEWEDSEGRNIIELCTREEAIKKWLLFVCPKCWDDMFFYEKKNNKVCFICSNS